MKTIRIAMLGSGFVAEFYMQGLANVNGQEVVSNYSRSVERAQAFARRWEIPESSSDLNSVISRDDIDLFVIALPNEEHLPVARMLAESKRNQVCTKPLARNGEEAQAMLEAVRASGALHGYAETEVFAPAVVKAREMIEAGGIGRVLWVRSRESHSGPHSPHFWDVEKTGGGAMNDLGCHCIAAARYFFGKERKITRVMAWGQRLVHHEKTEGEDNALLVLEFDGGGVAHCELSWTTKGGLDLRNEIHGDEGSIFTDVTRGTPIRAFTSQPSGYVIEKADLDFGWTQPLPEKRSPTAIKPRCGTSSNAFVTARRPAKHTKTAISSTACSMRGIAPCAKGAGLLPSSSQSPNYMKFRVCKPDSSAAASSAKPMRLSSTRRAASISRMRSLTSRLP